jgi:hypothetical protein
VAGTVLGVVIGGWLLARGVNLSALLGSAAGTIVASTVFAFVMRDRMRTKAEQSPQETVTGRAADRQAARRDVAAQPAAAYESIRAR